MSAADGKSKQSQQRRAGTSRRGEKPHDASKKKKEEELPDGWVRIESRSKPGAYFYAHPATKRTQVERPGAGPQLLDVDEMADAADAGLAARRAAREARRRAAEDARIAAEEEAARRAKAEAERAAEEKAREEALQKARERRARALQTDAADADDGDEEQMKAKRKRAWQEEHADERVEITWEEFEKWKEEEADRDETPDRAPAPAQAAHQQADDDDDDEDMEPRRVAVPAPPPEAVLEPCLDVLKGGVWVERHVLNAGSDKWTLGRAKGQVDFLMQHESISRHHSAIIREGPIFFVTDLGSAHGTVLDGRHVAKDTLARLRPGAQIRFGASTRLYVYREPGGA